MTDSIRRSNRGPAAAAGNRAAILAAARRVFAEQGYHAPLSAVAREAGVGQGVLYRHFRSRLDLAFATFESNFVEFEELAADPDPGTLRRMWIRLIELTVEESAFIEMIVEARRSLPDFRAGDRMRGLLEGPLSRAVAAGLVDPRVSTADLMLGPRIAYGIVATAVDGADRDEVLATVSRVLERAHLLPQLRRDA